MSAFFGSRPFQLGVGPAAVLALLAGVACARPAEPPPAEPVALPTTHEHTRMTSYPPDGVRLGQGWHGGPGLKAQAVCIDFEVLSDDGQEQTMGIEVVTDKSEVMDAMDISAEVQVKSMAYKVSGKAHFAKELEVSSESLNFIAHAEVRNGVAFTGPARYRDAHAVTLTPSYARLASEDPLEFERQCGDSYVAAIYSGAELSAMLSFTETSTSEHEQIEASMKGSGWGFSAEGSASKEMSKASSKGTLEVTFFQSGGKGAPMPTDEKGFLGAIARLPRLAAEAPAEYDIGVQGYRSLPNFPAETPAELESDFREDLAVSYGRLLTIREELTEILDDLAETPKIWVLGPGESQETLAAMQDEITRKLRRLREHAARCAFAGMPPESGAEDQSEADCELPEDLEAMNDYAYRVRLPVRALMPFATTADITQAASALARRLGVAGVRIGFDASVSHTAPRASAADIIRQRVRTVSNRRCDQDLDDPGCLTNEQIDALREELEAKLEAG